MTSEAAKLSEKAEYHHEYYERNKIAILFRQNITDKKYLQTEVGKQNKRANAIRMRAKYPEKARARNMVKDAIKAGRLVKGPCEVCGTDKIESHHDDYNKPLEVRWFCHQHHCEAEGRWIKREYKKEMAR